MEGWTHETTINRLEGELAQAVKDGNRLADALVTSREEVLVLKLQNDELRKALQELHDHPKLYPNMGDTRLETARKLLGITEKPKKEVGTIGQWDHIERAEEKRKDEVAPTNAGCGCTVTRTCFQHQKGE